MAPRTRAGIAAAFLAVAPLLAHGAQWPRMTGDSPLHPGALPPERVAAIVDEARRVAAVPHPRTTVTTLPTRWDTLDPDTLATLLRMPEWETIVGSDDTDAVLLQQAAAWDLLDFHRPSDLARLWGHVWPDSLRPTPDSAPFAFGAAYIPDPSWPPVPRAMAALLECLPEEAWTFAGDPVVEANRQPWSWSWDGSIDPDGFRGCVERTAQFLEPEEGYGPPHDPPGVVPKVVDVLKDRLLGALHVDGCRRSGPDSCLLLLQAVVALDPDDPRVPGVVRALEPGFRLDAPIDVPEVTPPDGQGEQDAASRAALAVPEAEALRRLGFLQTKARLLLRRPENWPPGELDRTVAQGTRAGLALGMAWSRMSWRAPHHLRRGVDLRPLLEAAPVARRVAASQRALGVAIADVDGCRYAELPADIIDPFAGTQEFWAAYLARNRQAGHPCR